MDIRTFTIKYCKRTKYKKKQYENSLESKLQILQHRIMNEDDIQEIQEEINAIEQELTSIANEKTAGAIIRSKAQWVEDGEKSTSFFLNLENRNYLNKYIT